MTTDPAPYTYTDWLLFLSYFLVLGTIGFLAGRRRSANRDYFLAGRSLPWYAIGCSMIAAQISGEQLVALVGASYTYGLVMANWCWLVFLNFSLLIFVFLPYYLNKGFFTMPEFLELRFGLTSRLLFAVVTLFINVVGLLGPTLYIGAIALDNFFGMNKAAAIILLAAVGGSYTIYGGLLSVAWTDVLQCVVIYAGGILLGVLSIIYAGGLATMRAARPEHYHVVQPLDGDVPFLAILLFIPAVAVWYTCTNQFFVQRCLAARSEWDSRMGVVLAGFLALLQPLFMVVPGLAAAVVLAPGELERPDNTYVAMVHHVIPVGLRGLMISALVAALISTIGSLVNSTATIVTVDFYQRFSPLPDHVDQGKLLRVGRISSLVALALGAGMALILLGHTGHIFAFIQNMYCYVAPPFATLFLLGILWRRPGVVAALLTIVVGLAAGAVAQYVVIPRFVQPILYPGRELPEFFFLYRVSAVWGLCVVTFIASSVIWPARGALYGKEIDIWKPRYLRLPREELAAYGGLKDFRLWWFLFVVCAVGLIIYFR